MTDTELPELKLSNPVDTDPDDLDAVADLHTAQVLAFAADLGSPATFIVEHTNGQRERLTVVDGEVTEDVDLGVEA